MFFPLLLFKRTAMLLATPRAMSLATALITPFAVTAVSTPAHAQAGTNPGGVMAVALPQGRQRLG